MKIVLASDSFKGSLSAEAVCTALETGLRRALPDAEIVKRPMADGGEGTLDAVCHALAAGQGLGARRKQALVRNAAGQSAEAGYALIKHGIYEAAMIEVAQIVGIEDAHNMAVLVGDRSGLRNHAPVRRQQRAHRRARRNGNLRPTKGRRHE